MKEYYLDWLLRKLEELYIRSQNHELISLTYGEIITYINNEALALCTHDMKLNNKIRYEKKETRRELGSLYAQWKNRSSFCLIKRQKKLKKKKTRLENIITIFGDPIKKRNTKGKSLKEIPKKNI